MDREDLILDQHPYGPWSGFPQVNFLLKDTQNVIFTLHLSWLVTPTNIVYGRSFELIHIPTNSVQMKTASKVIFSLFLFFKIIFVFLYNKFCSRPQLHFALNLNVTWPLCTTVLYPTTHIHSSFYQILAHPCPTN